MRNQQRPTTVERFESQLAQPMGILKYEMWYGEHAMRHLVEEMAALEVYSVDLAVLLDLRELLLRKFSNTGIIWALGPMRTSGFMPVLSTVVAGLSTDEGLEGIVHATVSPYGFDCPQVARYSFLVRCSNRVA
ncbi:MAG: hypothetical protein AAB384_03135 [Patescibacteria group bacterium]